MGWWAARSGGASSGRPFTKKNGPGARNRLLGELDGKLTASRDAAPARPSTGPGGGGQALGQTFGSLPGLCALTHSVLSWPLVSGGCKCPFKLIVNNLKLIKVKSNLKIQILRRTTF